ncbi:MAG: hypothetical protein AB7P03_03160 [Kofleriaceae bacterium]
MDTLFEAIRTATVPDATDEARAAAATTCRTILTALEAKPGEPMRTPDEPTSIPATAATAALLRSMPPEQLLDLLIAKLRRLVSAETPHQPRVCRSSW